MEKGLNNMERIFMTADQARIWSNYNNKSYDKVREIATMFNKKIKNATDIGFYCTYVSMDEVKKVTDKPYLVNEVIHHLQKIGYFIKPSYDNMEKGLYNLKLPLVYFSKKGLNGYQISWR